MKNRGFGIPLFSFLIGLAAAEPSLGYGSAYCANLDPGSIHHVNCIQVRPGVWEFCPGGVRPKAIPRRNVNQIQAVARNIANKPKPKPRPQTPAAKPEPAPENLTSGNLDQNFLAKLNRVAWNNATKCRTRARFIGGGVGCGNVSKAMCAQATRETINQMGIPMPAANAIDQRGFLKKSPHFEIIADGNNISQDLCRRAEPGVVCLYSTPRHRYGHIEVKASNARYCSDYCSGHSAVYNKRGQFKLVGVYRIKPKQ